MCNVYPINNGLPLLTLSPGESIMFHSINGMHITEERVLTLLAYHMITFKFEKNNDSDIEMHI